MHTRELADLTGLSPEMSAIGWRLRAFVTVEPAPSPRGGDIVRLTSDGLRAQEAYPQLSGAIEGRWADRDGGGTIPALRGHLEALLALDGGWRLAAGLVPPPVVRRSGHGLPVLGREAVRAKARQRMRDMVRQNEAFVRDPATALPHLPLWDGNPASAPDRGPRVRPPVRPSPGPRAHPARPLVDRLQEPITTLPASPRASARRRCAPGPGHPAGARTM